MPTEPMTQPTEPENAVSEGEEPQATVAEPTPQNADGEAPATPAPDSSEGTPPDAAEAASPPEETHEPLTPEEEAAIAAKQAEKARRKAEKEAVKAMVNRIVTELKEENRRAIKTLKRLVKVCGIEFAEKMLKRTLEIEAEGGMMIRNGTRRRTPGGTFFYIVKGELDMETRGKIFPEMRRVRLEKESPYPPMAWDERIEVWAKLAEGQEGAIKEVEVHMKGRPEMENIERRKDLVLMPFVQEIQPHGSMPRGVPEVPDNLQTITYAVYMSERHWEKIEKQVQKNAEDNVIINGIAAWDNDLDAVAVFAMHVTTEWFEKRDKQRQKAEEQKKAAADKKAQKGQQEKQSKEKDKGAAKAKQQPAAKKPKPAPEKPPEPSVPPEIKKKIESLRNARKTLEQKLAAASGGVGATMTKKMLENTTKQIEKLEAEYPDLKK